MTNHRFFAVALILLAIAGQCSAQAPQLQGVELQLDF